MMRNRTKILHCTRIFVFCLLTLCATLLQAQTPAPQPQSPATPPPEPTSILPRAEIRENAALREVTQALDVNIGERCNYLKAAYGLTALHKDGLLKLAKHGHTHCRALGECLGYLHQDEQSGSDSFLSTFKTAVCPDYSPASDNRSLGSVMDEANSLMQSIAQSSESLQTALKAGVRDSEQLRQLSGIAEHEYDLGNDEFLDVMTGDFDELFDSFFSCLDYSIEGLCHKTEKHWTPPFIELYIAALRRYRFPEQFVETSEHQGMTAYLPKDFAGVKLPEEMLEIGQYLLENGVGGIGDAYELVKIDRDAVNPALQGASAAPGAALGTGNLSNIEVTSQADNLAKERYNRIMDEIEDLPNSDTSKRIREQPGANTGLNMQYHMARSWFSVILGPIWQKMAIIVPHPHYFTISIGIAAVHLSTHFGGCHDRKASGWGETNGPGGCRQNNVTELSGAAMTPYWSEGGLYGPISVLLSHSSILGMAALLAPEEAVARITMPFACSIYNMSQGNERLQSPADMLIPGGRRSALAELVPEALKKHCGTGNQMGLYPVLARAPQLDPRAASEHQTLAGLKALAAALGIPRTSGSPMGRLYDYSDYRGEGNPDDDDNDQIQFIADEELKEAGDGCKAFGAKTLRYARDFSLVSRKKILGDEKKTAKHSVAYHWKRFKCCHPHKGDGIWLASDIEPKFIVYGNER